MAGGFTGFSSGVGENDLETGIVEGDSSNEATLVHKEFFWDKLTTFVASVLFGLATLNLFTQLLPRDSGIACDFSELNGSISDTTSDFLLGICSKALPPFTFLPVGVIVQGVLIAGPHFIWKSTFLSQLDYFFSSVNTLSIRRDPVTGHFPIENRVMIKQLESSFTFCDTSDIFTWYRKKLFVQFTVNLIVAVVSIAVPLTVFNSDMYSCSISSRIWPMQEANTSITCVLITFRLFSLIWACDITLILIMLPVLFWGILWCYLRHPTQLGHNDVAAFSFNSGIISKYAFSRPYFSSTHWRRNIQSRFFYPRIKNDLDFMLMLLFKVNDGVGKVFKEGLVEIEMERLNNIETQVLESYLRIQDDPDLKSGDGDDDCELLDKRDKDVLSLKWTFPAKDVQLSFKEIDLKNGIRIPNCIRGSIMGMSLRAPNNYRALEIGFGSTYGNYALALARIFFKVGYINFDASYRPTWRQNDPVDSLSIEKEDEDEISTINKKAQLTESIPHDLVHVNEISSSFISFRVQDNILTQSTEHIIKFYQQLYALFKDDDDVTPVSFIVIGPINQREHLTTVKLFLESTDAISDNTIIVTTRPVSIEGRNTRKYFHKFIPPKSVGFQLMSQVVEVVNEEVDWNDPLIKQQRIGTTQDFNPISVSCGTSLMQMELLMYQRCSHSNCSSVGSLPGGAVTSASP